MKMPGFNAEASLDPATDIYKGNTVFGSSGAVEVLPMLGKQCGNCELVGGLGGIRGVGMRSCCQNVWKWNPITNKLELSQQCWFESCSPVLQGGLLRF